MAESGGKTRKVAILGGGVAALTAAFELTEHDPDRNFDITVYTLGWRLGGKGSVGRDALRYDRGYEHGLHIWAGFYDNAFDVVKRLYARSRAGEDGWRDCFRSLNHFTVMENVEGNWKPWTIAFPSNKKDPGISRETNFSPWPMFVRFLAMLESALRNTDLPATVDAASRLTYVEALAAIEPLGRHAVDDHLALTITARAAGQLPADPDDVSDESRFALREMIDHSHRQICEALGEKASGEPDDRRRLRIVFDLAFALARGLLSDVLFHGGFDAIDDREWSCWMKEHGCSDASLDSAIVRGCYDYAFVNRKRGIGAGTATTLVLRFLLTYKGSVLHELAEPMGDFLFAPMYLYLKKEKEVKFKFFSRVDKLELDSDGLLDRIEIGEQVELAAGVEEYDPLVQRYDEHYSWPAAPRADQIKYGEWLKPGIKYQNPDLESDWTDWQDQGTKRVLRRRTPKTKDTDKDVFDLAIVALGFEGLKRVCKDLDSKLPAWKRFLTNIESTQTAALQLWLNPSTAELGWPDPRTALTGFETAQDEWPAAPMTSWEDNSGLLQQERDRNGLRPRGLAYFCGVFPDAFAIPTPGDPTYATFPFVERKRAWAATEVWMNERLIALWPKAVKDCPPGFDTSKLETFDSSQSIPDAQFFKVNIDASERYVLSVPGSGKHRLPPQSTGVPNLFLAGDFVRSGVNAGCIEAAVIAGRLVAEEITEADMTISGRSNSDLFKLPIGALPLVNVVDKLKSLAAGGLGTIEAYCITISEKKSFVDSKLADGLELVTPPKWKKTHPNEHPVMLVFCRQINVRPGFLPLGGLNYLEFLEMIPNVKRKDKQAPAGGPFTYLPHLLLNQPIAVTVGQNLYGLNKRMAHLAQDKGNFVVSSDLGEIQTWLEGIDLPGSIANTPKISHCRGFLGQPFICKKTTGEWVYSYLDYKLESATYQQIDGKYHIKPPFVEKELNYPSPKSDEDDRASLDLTYFRFVSQWRLSMPLTTGGASDTAAPEQISSVVSQWTGGRLGRILEP